MVHLATVLSTSAVVASLVPSIVVAAPIQASASEEGLVEREPFFPLLGLAAGAIGSIFKGRKRDLSEDDLDLISRLSSDELTDLMERSPEPFFPLLGLAAGAIGSIFKGRKRDFSDEDLDLITRLNTDELAERAPEPFFPLLGLAAGAIGSIFKGRKRGFGDFTGEDLDLISRADPADLAELVRRNPEPFFPLLGLAAGAIGSIFKGRKRDLALADYEDVFERDFTQLEGLEMRELEDFEDFEMREFDDEMIAREWADLEELD